MAQSQLFQIREKPALNTIFYLMRTYFLLKWSRAKNQKIDGNVSTGPGGNDRKFDGKWFQRERERDIETNAHKTLVLYLYKYMQMVVHVCALCGLTRSIQWHQHQITHWSVRNNGLLLMMLTLKGDSKMLARVAPRQLEGSLPPHKSIGRSMTCLSAKVRSPCRSL